RIVASRALAERVRSEERPRLRRTNRNYSRHAGRMARPCMTNRLAGKLGTAGGAAMLQHRRSLPKKVRAKRPVRQSWLVVSEPQRMGHSLRVAHGLDLLGSKQEIGFLNGYSGFRPPIVAALDSIDRCPLDN